MPPRSPLPRRGGLDASWVRTPDRTPGTPWPEFCYRDFLISRLGAHADIDALLAEGAFVDQRGRTVRGTEPCPPSTIVWFYRPRPAESTLAGPVHVLYADERIVVVDKPHFLASTPRGSHITESVVARLRVTGWPDVAPAHRLDRLTAGVLLLTRERRWRAAYAGVFADGRAQKTYEAIAPVAPERAWPLTVTGRIEKDPGTLQARLVDGPPNATTEVDCVEVRAAVARYRLSPATGKTHQLRLQMASLGLPIVGDPLYPHLRNTPEDWADPLRLVARQLRFRDPVTGTLHDFTSAAQLTWPDPAGLAD